MSNKERIEIEPGFFVGETVILLEETEFTKVHKIKIGTVGVVSKDDNLETLKGWKAINVEEGFKSEIDKMTPEKIDELYNHLSRIGKIKNADKLDDLAKIKTNKQ
mgnify:CR=1 FL=1|tara:strand:- start:506 stop:820 length:315 start_codon:yes stop_codon:yes gene_type:complete